MNEEYFPSEGERVTINIGTIDYSQELWKIQLLVEKLKNEPDIINSVDSWFLEFKRYIEDNQLVQGTFVRSHLFPS